MCGRYFIEADVFEAEFPLGEGVKKAGEIFPGDTVPVFANSRVLEPKLFGMTWGYSAYGKRIINARSETAETRPLFAEGMEKRRCLLPASNYFEWERSTRKKLAIRPAEPFYIAAIYRFENGVPVFTVLTRDPCEELQSIHDRMPVLFPTDLLKDWLNPRYKGSDLLCHAETSGFRVSEA